jgi:predicted aldo/keto reductase-like oxidoreductase
MNIQIICKRKEISMPNNQQPEQSTSRELRTLSRREFVKRLSALTTMGGLFSSVFGGYMLTSSQQVEAAEAMLAQFGKLPKHQLGKKMGKMEVVPILICQDSNPQLLGPCLAAGMNFIHKAGYWNSMPNELKKIPRESYFTDITVDSTPNNPDNEEGAYQQVVQSLQKNGFQYYDIFRAHFGWKTVDALKNQRGTYRAFQRLKKEGKVRYFGVSQHDWIPYPEIIEAIIEDGTVCSIQAFIHYGTPPDAWAIFEKAHKAGIGITAMKTVAYGGAPMRNNPAEQAKMKASGRIGCSCIREVLTHKGSDGKPIVDVCVSSLQNFDMLQENLGAIAPKICKQDGFKLI